MIGALVPAKALDQAKGRLAALLSEDERRQLALAMLTDVLNALQAVPSLDTIAVVSPDSDVLEHARSSGAGAIQEPQTVRGINQALSHALHSPIVRGIDTLVVVLADVPEITPADVQQVIDAVPFPRGIVICPSRDKGTSILAARPPSVIPFRFGPLSFSAHKREAAAQGLEAQVLHIETLAADIDSPADLQNLLSRPAETATQRLLARLGVAARAGG